MDKKLIFLENDDVVLIGEDTFKVAKLKQLLELEIKNKLNKGTYDSRNNNQDGYIYNLLQYIRIGENRNIPINQIDYNLKTRCEILQTCGKGWEKGEMKIKISVVSIVERRCNVNLEFHMDNNIENESPLDDLRQMIKSE